MNVIELSSRRKKQLHQPSGEYFCTRCNGNSFRFWADGEIRCWPCGAVMKNLSVTPKERA